LAGGLRQTANDLLEEVMKSLALKVQRFLASEDGPTAVEYAVMLALIVIVCLTAIQAIGTNANTTFNSIGNAINNANTTGGAGS
jgi:pilus assembly protein Flp/PilA